jgi:hypothetical protein
MKIPSILKRIMVLAAVTTFFACSSPTDKSSTASQDYNKAPTTNEEQVALLSHLVGRSLDTSAPTIPTGADPASYNPMGGSQPVINKESEIFLAGMHGQGSSGFNNNDIGAAVLDGKLGDTNPMGTLWQTTKRADFTWTDKPKKLVGADVDGDGRDELCVLYMDNAYTSTGDSVAKRNLKLAVYDGTPSSVNLLFEDKIATYTDAQVQIFYASDDLWNASLDLAAGHILGTKESQLAISVMGTISIIGGASNDYALLGSVTDLNTYASGVVGRQIVKIACGDFDGDGKDELAAVDGVINGGSSGSGGIAYLYVFDGGVKTRLVDGVSIDNGKGLALKSGSIAAGDVDGDGTAEIILCGNDNNGGAMTLVLDDAAATSPFAPVAWAKMDGASAWYTIGCAAIDYNGDGVKEIIGYTRLFDNLNNATGGTLSLLVSNLIDEKDDNGMYYDDCLAVGQFNQSLTASSVDTCEDVIFDPASQKDLHLICWSAKDGPTVQVQFNINEKNSAYPCLAAANIDDDSTVVRYDGREILYTDPHPVAFLSCYPYWDGIDMSYNAGSSYTTGQTKSSDSSTSVGVSASVCVGYETDEAGSGWGVQVEVAASFDYSWGSGSSQSTSVTFTSGAEDKVVFTTIPYDVYYYHILSTPDGKGVDTEMVVNVPRSPVITAVPVDYYNANNGDCQDITADNLITHTIGNPKSYPSVAFLQARVADDSMVIYRQDILTNPELSAMDAPSVQVGIGPGSTEIDLSYSSTNSHNWSAEQSITISGKIKKAGFYIGGSVGFHFGESFSVSTGKDTSFSGVIGNIPVSAASEGKAFPWTLFVYKKPLTAGGTDTVLVLEYCVENNGN